MSKKTGEQIINQIRHLRSRGYTIPEISKQLAVPKTTVHTYATKVSILPAYISLWTAKRGASQRRQKEAQHAAFLWAKQNISSLSNKELLLIISTLYWGEGTKGAFSLSNTDPNLIWLFMYGLRKVFNIKDEDFRLTIRIYEDIDKDKCLKYWSSITNIPVQQFVNVNVLVGKKHGKLEYGMCRVRISKGGNVLKKIKSINNIVIKHFLSSRSSMDRAAHS